MFTTSHGVSPGGIIQETGIPRTHINSGYLSNLGSLKSQYDEFNYCPVFLTCHWEQFLIQGGQKIKQWSHLQPKMDFFGHFGGGGRRETQGGHKGADTPAWGTCQALPLTPSSPFLQYGLFLILWRWERVGGRKASLRGYAVMCLF